MKLALVTHHERPRLRGTLPDLWPEFMSHDSVVQAFWPKLYDVYPDFQIWVVDREAQPRRAIGYACSVPVAWDDDAPSPRGLSWALTDGVEAPPTALCAVVAGLAPEYRGQGIAEAILRRLGSVAAGHGLELLVAPVRPTWKERYPLVPIQRYAAWRRSDGLPYDPWLRTHERLGGEMLASAPRSMTVRGTRAEWEEWTGMTFPDDGDYVVPGGLVPVHFKNGRGLYVEPNVWVRHQV
jgi:GNAT superfamily N-acetyltransferase